MKLIFRFATLFSLATMLLFAACTEDACKTNPPVCKSGAGCLNGACVCPNGFAGMDCGDTLRNPFFWRKRKLLANSSGIVFRDSATTYKGIERNLSVTPNTADTITVTLSSVSAYNKVAITNLGNNIGNPYYCEAIIASGAKFSLSSYKLTETTYMQNLTGALTGTELNITYSTQSNVPGVAPTNYTFKGVRQ